MTEDSQTPPRLSDPRMLGAVERQQAAVDHPDLDRMLEGLESQIQSERGPKAWLSQMQTGRRAGVLALGAVATIGVILATTPRADLDVFPAARWLSDLSLLVAPALAALVVAMRPLFKPFAPRRTEAAVILAAVIGVLFQVGLPPAHVHHPESLAGTGPDLWPRALRCLAFGASAALPVWLLLGVLSREGRGVLLPQWIPVVGAAMVGSVGVFVHCPITQPVHLLAGHAPILGLYLLVPLVAAVWVRRSS